MSQVERSLVKLDLIGRSFPSLTSEIATFKEYILLLGSMIECMHYSKEIQRKQQDIQTSFYTYVVGSINQFEVTSVTPKARAETVVTQGISTMRDIKPAVKEVYTLQLELKYGKGHVLQSDVEEFVHHLVLVQQQLLSCSKPAILSVHNLRSYVYLSKRLAKVCANEGSKIWQRAQTLANHTAIFLYSCWDLKMAESTDPHDGDSSSLSRDSPSGDEHEMNFVEHLLLYLKNQITCCQECQATSVFPSLLKDKLEKLHTYVTLVKDVVPYSPQFRQNMSSKIALHESIIKSAISISSFSFAKDLGDNSGKEKNLELLGAFDEIFNQIGAELVKAGARDHLVSDRLFKFLDDMVAVQQDLLSFGGQAVISVENLRSYLNLSKHLANACVNEEALLTKIWCRAQSVADHTAKFLYSCWAEPAMDLDLKLIDLLQMNDPTNPVVSGFYLQIFKSFSFSEDSPLADEHEMNFIGHLVLHLKKQITHCQEGQAASVLKDQLEKLHVYVTLVKDIVLYSPLSVQNMCSKITLHEIIIKSAITVSSFSYENSEECLGEENNPALLGSLDENFNQIAAELVKASFVEQLILHFKKQILNCQSRSIVHSLKGPLEKFSEYMTLVKVVVPYPPLRYMFSKIILQKVIVKFVIIISSSSSFDIEEIEDGTGKEENLVSTPEFDVSNLIDEYLKFTADVNPTSEELRDLHVDMKYEVNGEEAIGQYIDGLEEVQNQYLSFNNQAMSSIQNLRSFQQLGKVIVKWYKNEDMLNMLMSQLLLAVENTAIFLCSCWIEPETNHELELADLLHLTNIKNPKVQRIYVHGFMSLRQSEYSPWPYEVAEAGFIDHLLLYLKELMQCEGRSIVASLKVQSEKLHKYLTALRYMVAVKDKVPLSTVQYMPSRMNPFHSLVVKSVMKMAKFSIDDSKEDAGKKNIALPCDLEENISLMKLELRKSIIFDYPSIGAEFFSIFKNLEQMLTFRTDEIYPMKHQIDMIYADLMKLRSFMNKIKDKQIENKEMKDLCQLIFQVSHKAEFVIQSYVNRDGPTYYHSLQLSVVMEDIQLLITEIEGHDTDTGSYSKPVENQRNRSSEASTSITSDIVVGYEDELDKILAQVKGNSQKRDIVAIVGIPGLGKTTIAKNVYNCFSVANRFDRRAWCFVSQSYQTRELLLQILRSITVVNEDQILKKNDEEIANLLKQSLKQRRYLIVLDDVWETKVWVDLKKSFPDDNNGSRVIVTSRNLHVAQRLIQATPNGYVHSLRVFHDKESCILLQHRLFPWGRFPQELSHAAMVIAKNCKGLPLRVVLAAGILSRMEKIESQWLEFALSLSTQMLNEDGNQYKNLIELSYTHLPDHLKCCFLYFGAFPEDKEISARKLAWLWIAEGFVRDDNQGRLEDIAESYLMELIGRSLVIGSKRASRPGIKSCHVHVLLREFCLAKAEEEKFHQVVRGYEKYLPPDVGQLDYGVDSGHPLDPSKITHPHYRLSIYSKRKHFIMARPSGPNVRTLFFHALPDMYPNYPYVASFISRYFKLIKVLDLESINIQDSLTGVVLMLHLRYLAVKGHIESIPETIYNLCNLETFILRGSRVADISAPYSIWSLLRLRRLHIDGNTSFKFDSKGIAGSTILADMESFSTPIISYGDEAEEMLRKVPNLRKLKCIFLDSWNYVKRCNEFPVLEFLTQLVSLNVSCYYSAWRYPCRFSFPSNLTKLTLSEFELPWREISAIGRLPNLNALKLLSRAFTGKRWVMGKEDTFPSLKFLKLESLDIEEWSASEEHLPSLQRLMLSKCKKLKKVPSEFADIDPLEVIEVLWCNPSAANSVRSIQENAEYNGGDTLKVHIYPKEENSDAYS